MIEAQRLGREAFGCDVNPASVMISRAKTLPLDADRASAILAESLKAALRAQPHDRVYIPGTVQVEKWYSPNVAAVLGAVYRDLDATNEPDSKLLKTLCFSSILLKVCRETRHWGFVCDNTEPKEHPPRRVVDALDRAINEIVDAFKNLKSPRPPAIIAQSLASSITDHLIDQSVDLVVTSPPYEGVVDYVKAQRLTLEWLGVDVEQFRRLETGARSKRHRRKASVEFAEELRQSFIAIRRVLKNNAPCAVVFGVSPRRQFTFDHFLSIMTEVGFVLRTDQAREVPRQRRMMPSVLSERMMVFTKSPGD